MQPTTVFVLGAGSSFEFNLPVGETLKKEIADLMQSKSSNPDNPEHHLQNAIQTLAQNGNQFDNHSWHEYDLAKLAISRGLPVAYSIDNFLDAQQHNKYIVDSGKLGIVSAILRAERNSNLVVKVARQGQQAGGFDAISSARTWLNSLIQRIFMGTRFENLPERLARYAFINFNYDRCVEYFLINAIMLYYNRSVTDAVTVARDLQIYHPYGSLAPLPWQSGKGLQYGMLANHIHLTDSMTRIRTFTESQTTGHSDLEKAQMWLFKSERMVFLGFGYIPLNMQLLFPRKYNYEGKVFGTVYGSSPSNTKQLGIYFSETLNCVSELVPTECKQFIVDYERELGLI